MPQTETDLEMAERHVAEGEARVARATTEPRDLFEVQVLFVFVRATDTLRDVFFSNMSERAGKILREDMEAMGPVRLKDVDDAQMRMVNVAKDLANKGEIMIASKQGEDELIY